MIKYEKVGKASEDEVERDTKEPVGVVNSHSDFSPRAYIPCDHVKTGKLSINIVAGNSCGIGILRGSKWKVFCCRHVRFLPRLKGRMACVDALIWW